MIIAFDTNVLVYLLEFDERYGPVARDALASALENGQAAISVIAVAEYLASGGADTKLFEKLPGIALVPVNLEAAKRAADIRRNFKNVHLPDALHMACAIACGAAQFVTNDRALLKLQRVDQLKITPLA